MKSIYKFFMVYGVVVTGLCIYLVVLSFGGLTQTNMNDAVEARTTQATNSMDTEEEEIFQLGIRDGHVVILKGDDVFEVTSIAEDEMSEELRTEVEGGTFFHSEEEVYSFLESYTS